MVGQINYTDLEKRFSLQKRPYITIANALKHLYEDLLKGTGLTTQEIAPFTFAVLETQSDGNHFLRWLTVYNQTRLKNILEKKNLFHKYANKVFKKNPKSLELDRYYYQVLLKTDPVNDIEFLTAVFQLTYGFPIPIAFNDGLIHKAHQKRRSQSPLMSDQPFYYYFAERCTKLSPDLAGLSPLKIEHTPPQHQVDEDFFHNDHHEYEFFYKDWYSLLLLDPPYSQNYDLIKGFHYNYYLYFPIYDGLPSPSVQGTLRGYLGIFCANQFCREKIFQYFSQRIHVVQAAINEAFREGIQNSLVDNYTNTELDPVAYWIHNLERLQQWSEIKLTRLYSSKEVFEFDPPFCKISIFKLLKRSSVIRLIDADLLETYQNHFLSLRIPVPPFDTIGLDNLDSRSPYLEKRVKEAVNLLDDLLQKYHILKSEEKIKIAARKAAMAAIMSRNMSHNIGSHVSPRSFLENIRNRLSLNPQNTQSEFKILAHLKRKLDCYIQEKADFLSEIVSEPLTTTKSMMFYRELLLPFIENSLLMDNLAANENLNYLTQKSTSPYQNRLYIRTQINGKELKAHYECISCKTVYTYPNMLPYSLRCPACLEVLDMQLENGEYDIEIDLPGPLGEYAFYSFLENLIRNAAKHNHGKCSVSSQELVITIAIQEDSETGFYQMDIWDSSSNPHQPRNGQPLCKWLNAIITEPLINEKDGSLRRNSWGMAEMKICATLLRGSTNFTNLSKNLTVLANTKDRKKRLIYRLKIMKPRVACLVMPSWNNHQQTQLFSQAGIYIFTSLNQLAKFLKAGDTTASFKFALFDASSPEKMRQLSRLPALLPKLPFRVLVIAPKSPNQLSGPLKTLIQQKHLLQISAPSTLPQTSSKLICWLWRNWLNRWTKHKYTVAEIYLQQYLHETPTDQWSQIANTFNQLSPKPELALRILGKDGSNTLLPQPAERHIFYDRHGGALEKLDFDGHFLKEHTYMLLDKNSPDFVSLFHPQFLLDATSGNCFLPYQLIEAGLLRIMIIDERIVENTFKTLESDPNALPVKFFLGLRRSEAPTLWHFAWAAKVHICTHFGVQYPEPLHSIFSQSTRLPFLKTRIIPQKNHLQLGHQWQIGNHSSNSLDIDMLIIHQTLLDRLPFDQLEFLNEIKKQIPFIIVDSGRGIPHSLAPQAKFLPFSLLQHYLMGERIAKFNLTKLVMSLTRKRGESI